MKLKYFARLHKLTKCKAWCGVVICWVWPNNPLSILRTFMVIFVIVRQNIIHEYSRMDIFCVGTKNSTTRSYVAARMAFSVPHLFVEPRKQTYLCFFKYLFQSQHSFETMKIFIHVCEKYSSSFMFSISFHLQSRNV